MTLRMTTKTTNYIEIYDLCSFLSEKIGTNVEYGEAHNDTSYTVTIKKAPVLDYDRPTINEFLKDGYLNMDYGYHIVLIHAVNEGWLDEGNYVIRVSW